MYLALFRVKICPECGIWPPEHLDLNKKARIPSYEAEQNAGFHAGGHENFRSNTYKLDILLLQ